MSSRHRLPVDLVVLPIAGIGNCFASVPNLFSWLYWLAANQPGEAFTSGPNFFPFLEEAIQAGSGTVLTIFSPALGRKLARVAPGGGAAP